MKTLQDLPVDIEKLQESLIVKPPVDPLLFFNPIKELSESAQILCAISAAVKVGLFDLIITPKTTEEISASFPYPDIIPPLLVILDKWGLIAVTSSGYQLTDLAKCYFSSDSPYNQINYLEKLIFHIKDLWLDLPEIVLNGPIVYDEQEFFAHQSLPSMASNALTGRLQDITHAIVALPRFSHARSLLDLGGGHGLYAMALAKCNRSLLAKVLDLPDVIPLTKKYIVRYNMEDQVSAIGGDFFVDNIGAEYDIILSSSNPSGKSLEMIPKIASALNPGGYFINVQPGDSDTDKDPCNMLEWELWNFSGSHLPKSGWEKKKRFDTPEYRDVLISAGLSMYSVTTISDPYIRGYTVTMIITEKI